MDSTFNQRKAIFNMRSALGTSISGIRDLSFDQASKEIDALKKRIKSNGFPEQQDESYLDGKDGRFCCE